ncbi:hypothetical protein JHW43_004100 [Diplocarpon mali]|nr:hypothetical protein JHW43_004100 [Diplocarpon mali]
MADFTAGSAAGKPTVLREIQRPASETASQRNVSRVTPAVLPTDLEAYRMLQRLHVTPSLLKRGIVELCSQENQTTKETNTMNKTRDQDQGTALTSTSTAYCYLTFKDTKCSCVAQHSQTRELH